MLIQCIINNHKKMKHRYVDLNFKVIEFYFNVYSFLKSFWNLMYVNGIRKTAKYHIISKDIIWSPIQDSNSTKFGILVVKKLLNQKKYDTRKTIKSIILNSLYKHCQTLQMFMLLTRSLFITRFRLRSI